ncbi:hypothetical protein IQ06DRAFT_372271 [Phaeosphaeriaceae sp. SRC1lsM3a]|nr:hypothetical protein IQ06DRAFT_372271 [Stagonospora sp. SRC1lsM3a]
MNNITVSAQAKAAMIVNLELELKNRAEKLRAMCEAQCQSLRSRLERRVNRVPATKRQMPLVELLAPAAPPAPAPKPATTRAAPKATTTKKAAAAATTTAAPATRKTRTAPTTATTTTKPAAPKTTAATTKTTTTRQPAARGKKRGSDEMSSEDKENAALDVPKKRVRAPAQKEKAPVSKPTTRTTRAASRQKPAAAQILSPKNNNARQKPTAKSSTRPR